MKKKPARTIWIPTVLTMLILCVLIVPAQDTRCDLVPALSQGLPDCWEHSAMDGSTIVVPGNVTRFSNHEMGICIPPEKGLAEPADILWVLDQSGSMRWNDKTFYVPTAASLSLDLAHQLAPNSTGGLIGFAARNCMEYPGGVLSDAAVMENIKAQLAYSPEDYDCGENQAGTNYYQSLAKAEEYLKDQTRSRHERKAIVFVTDGNPNRQTNEFWSLVERNDFPPVHAIRIQDLGTFDTPPSEAELRLMELAYKTGGAFYPVRPSDPEQIREVMASIISHVVAERIPQSITLANETNGRSAGSVAGSFLAGPGGRYRAILSDIVALDPGKNDMNLKRTILNRRTGKSETESLRFTVEVSGSPQGRTGRRSTPSKQAEAICYENSEIQVLDAAENAVTRLGRYESEIRSRLTTAPTVVGDLRLSFTTIQAADKEDSQVGSPGPENRNNSYKISLPFSETTGDGVSGNGKVEARLGDSILIQWAHPSDPRDTAWTILPVANLVATPYADTTGDFSCEIEVALATETEGAEIWYRTDGKAPLPNGPGTTLFRTGEKIKITESTSLMAIATKDGMEPSNVMVEKYKNRNQTKIKADPPGGYYREGQTVTLSVEGGEGTLWYTLSPDGNGDPIPGASRKYEGPITIGESAHLRATLESDCQTQDLREKYVISDTLPEPSIHGHGDFDGSGFVELKHQMDNVELWYTLDGSDPISGKSLRFEAPFPLTNTTTVKAIASLTGWVDSPIAEKQFTMSAPRPQADPPGGQYPGPVSVRLFTGIPNSTIYYCLDCKQTDPSGKGMLTFDPAQPIAIETDGTVLRAIAVHPDLEPSREMHEVYVIDDRLPMPRALPSQPEFRGAIQISLGVKTDIPGVELWYRLDGQSPQPGVPGTHLYTKPFPLDSSAGLRAVSHKTGWRQSDVLAIDYRKLPAQAGDIAEAIILDSDGDGLADRISIQLTDSSLMLEHTALTLQLPGISLSNGIHVQDVSAVKPGRVEFRLASNQARIIGDSEMRIEDDQKERDGGLRPGAYLLRDGVAPVLESAGFTPTGEDEGGELTLVFWEAPSSQLFAGTFFEIEGTDGRRRRLSTTEGRKSGDRLWIFAVSMDSPVPGEKIHLFPDAGIADAVGNSQRHEENRWVPVILKFRPIFESKPVHALQGQATENRDVEWWVEMSGESTASLPRGVSSVQPSGGESGLGLPGLQLELNAPGDLHIRIYDHFGQFVDETRLDLAAGAYQQLPDSDTQGARRLVVYWNALSSNGVRVGTGVYLFHYKLVMKPASGARPFRDGVHRVGWVSAGWR